MNALVVLLLILVHGPDGQEIELNVAEVSSLRQPRESTEGHVDKDVHCLIFMTNGKFVGTGESCEEVIKLIVSVEKESPK